MAIFDGRRLPTSTTPRPTQPLPQTPPPMPPPAPPPVAPPPAAPAPVAPARTAQASTQRYIPPGLTTRSSSSKELDERKMRPGGRGSQPLPGAGMIPKDFPTSQDPNPRPGPIPAGAVFDEASRRGQRTEDNPGGYGRITPGTTMHIGQGSAQQSGGGYPMGQGNPFAQAAQKAGFKDFAPKVPIDRRPSTGGRVRAHMQQLSDSLRGVFGGKRGKGGDSDG